MNLNPLPKYKPERYEYLRRRVALDLLAVDEELSKIGQLIQEAGEHCAFTNETMDMAKDELARVEAQVANKLRQTPQGDGKLPSETRIGSMIALDETFQDMQTMYSVAKLDRALWGTVMDALRVKSSSMRAAADLVQAGFISNDSILSKRRMDMRAVPARAQVTT